MVEGYSFYGDKIEIMLRVSNLTFRYNQDSDFLWKPLDFKLEPGKALLVKGKNGSGKTTFLNCLCGIIPRVITGEMKGEINFRERPVSNLPLKEIAPEINILFQEPEKQIFMPIVEDEIVFGMENLCLGQDEIHQRLNILLKRLNIEHLRKMPTASLSFGQKKLVALASVLAISPALILIDEFSAGIEEGMITLFQDYVKELKAEGKSFVFAEHHNAFQELADLSIDMDEPDSFLAFR